MYKVIKFILWSVAEKVGALLQRLYYSNFPNVTYRRGASGALLTVLRGTGIRVQTIVTRSENMTPADIAADYDLTLFSVPAPLARHETENIGLRDDSDQTTGLIHHG